MNTPSPLRLLAGAAVIALGCTLAISAVQPQNTAPEFDADIATQFVPAGKTLVVPVMAHDADGNPLTYSVSSSSKAVLVRVKTGNPDLVMTVNYSGTSGSPSPGAAAFSGTLTFQMFRDLTPNTASIIGGLAQGGFYDGLTFHRISSLDGSGNPSSIIAQGGDPDGDGTGGPGFRFDNELHPGLIFTGKGQLAMANSGHDSSDNFNATNGSQFFITNGPQRPLDFNHTIFGQLVRGFDVLDEIVNVPTDANGKPTSDVVIQSADVVPNHGDAVLYLSAITTGTASISVRIWDGKTFASDGKTPRYTTKTFQAVAVNDTINDPPFLSPVPDTVAPLGTVAGIPLHGIDLEFDYLSYGRIAGTGNNAHVEAANSNVVAVSSGSSAGPVIVPFVVSAFGQQNRGSTQLIYDFQTATIGFGDKKLTAQPATIMTSSTASGVLATFTDADTAETTASHFTATVNWGDGTPVVSSTGGSVAIVTSGSSSPQPFKVTGTHGYQHEGQFPLTVMINDVNGATATAAGTVFVSANPLVAKGVALTTTGLVNGLIANFSETGTHAAGEYAASIDWGDGIMTPGSIVTGSNIVTTMTSGTITTTSTSSGFNVVGRHNFTDSEPFAVSVSVTGSGANPSTAWSTVEVNNARAAKHFPPFAQGHLVGNFVPEDPRNLASPTAPFQDSTTSGGTFQGLLKFSIVVLNSGNRPVNRGSLRFYVSGTPDLVKTGPNAATLLRVSRTTTRTAIGLPNLAPGFGERFDFRAPNPLSSTPTPDTRIPGPPGVNTAGGYLIVEMVYTDPLTDHEAVTRTFSAQINQSP